ncbi:MAG: aryl-sulfate sulfotransferase, partial [Actinomycetia bacterium]|nr:aryl-sulfate sulfotransferase [Actinomycetes bacterium]
WRYDDPRVNHDVNVLPNGNITIFDNGVHRVPRGHDTSDEIASFCTSRALEIDPVKNEIVWEYIDPLHIMFTNFCGSNEKLPNGNYFICESRTGTFYEITPDKEVVWKYVSPFVINGPAIFGWILAKLIFQAHRYGTDYEGLKGKDLDPEKYEWVIQPKSKTTLDEEANVKSRLAKAGY